MRPWILLVEDDEDDVYFFTRAVKQANLPVELTVTKDGALACGLVDKISGDPAADAPRLAVLDLKLPKMNGLDVLRRIRESQRLKELPVVILTASDDRNDRRVAEALGVSAFLRKPSDTEALRGVVRKIGGILSL